MTVAQKPEKPSERHYGNNNLELRQHSDKPLPAGPRTPPSRRVSSNLSHLYAIGGGGNHEASSRQIGFVPGKVSSEPRVRLSGRFDWVKPQTLVTWHLRSAKKSITKPAQLFKNGSERSVGAIAATPIPRRRYHRVCPAFRCCAVPRASFRMR